MGRLLYEHVPEARALFERADALLDFPLSRLCFEGPAEQLTDTIHAQPALFVTALATLEAARRLGLLPQPAWVIGHSLGHFTALVAAGALDFEDGLRLVRARAGAMQAAAQKNPGGMAAVIRLGRDALEEACRQARAETKAYVGIANDNAPDQIVISGAPPALARAGELARQAGARRVISLAVSGAFHSPLMEEAADALRPVVRGIAFQAPAVPILSNVTARPLTDAAEVREDILLQITSPVRWRETVEYLAGGGAGEFIEIGPGTVLTGLAGRTAPEVPARAIGPENVLASRADTPLDEDIAGVKRNV